mmetsp:Transcript_11953/g.12017  ORF Transcript_11953/g.12017 Transcript_11953/m.12017 type:complete len:217 (+) Transcript_11953:152-802(+)
MTLLILPCKVTILVLLLCKSSSFVLNGKIYPAVTHSPSVKSISLNSKNSPHDNMHEVARSVIVSALISLSVLSTVNILPSVAASNFPEMSRYEAGLAELKRLDSNWDRIVQGEGDNIRRCLGTVYTPPKCENPLCSFPTFTEKFIRAHGDELDLEEFEEPSSALLTALNQADFLAYSAIFSEYGNGGGGADYINDSHKQVKKAIDLMQQVIDVIKK